MNATQCIFPYYELFQANSFKAWENIILSGLAWTAEVLMWYIRSVGTKMSTYHWKQICVTEKCITTFLDGKESGLLHVVYCEVSGSPWWFTGTSHAALKRGKAWDMSWQTSCSAVGIRIHEWVELDVLRLLSWRQKNLEIKAYFTNFLNFCKPLLCIVGETVILNNWAQMLNCNYLSAKLHQNPQAV